MGALLAGIFLELLASLCSATGVNVQSLAARLHSKLLVGCGIGLVVLGGGLDVAAYSVAPQSIMSPLGVSVLVFNVAISAFIHPEPVRRSGERGH